MSFPSLIERNRNPAPVTNTPPRGTRLRRQRGCAIQETRHRPARRSASEERVHPYAITTKMARIDPMIDTAQRDIDARTDLQSAGSAIATGEPREAARLVQDPCFVQGLSRTTTLKSPLSLRLLKSHTKAARGSSEACLVPQRAPGKPTQQVDLFSSLLHHCRSLPSRWSWDRKVRPDHRSCLPCRRPDKLARRIKDLPRAADVQEPREGYCRRRRYRPCFDARGPSLLGEGTARTRGSVYRYNRSRAVDGRALNDGRRPGLLFHLILVSLFLRMCSLKKPYVPA
jgi:hypothetical protein